MARGMIDGWDLIVGTNHEFCMTVYGALLGRLPDKGAFEHYLALDATVETRVFEVNRVLASQEFARRNVSCAFSEGRDPPDLQDITLRLSNFLSYVLNHFYWLQLNAMRNTEAKADGIAALIKDALVEIQAADLAERLTDKAPDTMARETLSDLEQRIRALEVLQDGSRDAPRDGSRDGSGEGPQ